MDTWMGYPLNCYDYYCGAKNNVYLDQMHKKENLRANYKEGRVKWSQINVDSDQILKLGLEPRSRYPRPNFLHILPVCQTGKEIHKSKLMMMKYMYTGLFFACF